MLAAAVESFVATIEGEARRASRKRKAMCDAMKGEVQSLCDANAFEMVKVWYEKLKALEGQEAGLQQHSSQACVTLRAQAKAHEEARAITSRMRLEVERSLEEVARLEEPASRSIALREELDAAELHAKREFYSVEANRTIVAQLMGIA